MKRVRLDIDQLHLDSFVIPNAAGAPGSPNGAGPVGATEGSSVDNCCCA
jgi:hypothetical protein